MYTSFLCEAVELLFLTTPSQVESLHSDVQGTLPAEKVKMWWITNEQTLLRTVCMCICIIALYDDCSMAVENVLCLVV